MKMMPPSSRVLFFFAALLVVAAAYLGSNSTPCVPGLGNLTRATDQTVCVSDTPAEGPSKLDIRGMQVSPNRVDRRLIDRTSTVRPEHLSNNPLGVSAAEWQARTELAAAYRGLYLHGLERGTIGSDQAAQCLMLRHPDHKQEFLMAEWGVWFEEVTASSLLRYDWHDGVLIEHDGSRSPAEPGRSNTGCIPVAAALFRSRADVNMVVHVHPIAVMAVGGLKEGLLPLSQAAFFLHGQISREDYDFSYESSFESTLSHGFAHGERAMILNHHGMYAVGRDAAEAVFVATHLTQACEVQAKTLAMVGGDLSKLILPAKRDLDRQYADMMNSADYAYDGSREWPGLVRKVMRAAPEFNM